METEGVRKVNYRELQATAKSLRLPGNLKYHLLLEIIEARKSGKEYIVNRILTEQKMERVKRKNEKMEAREGAYQHLQIKNRKPIKTRKTSSQIPERSTMTQWAPQVLQDPPDIQALLSMPSESFQELLRKTKDHEYIRFQNTPPERRLCYSQYQEYVQQKLSFPNQINNQDLLQSTSEDTDSVLRNEISAQSLNRNFVGYYQRPDYLANSVQFASQNQESKRSSFQMREILNQNDINWQVNLNYGPSYLDNNSYNLTQMSSDVATYMPETFLAHYPQYLQSSDHWRNLYGANQDSFNWQCIDFSGYQANTSVYSEAVSSPNSDTISATEDETMKETVITSEDNQFNNASAVYSSNFCPPTPQPNIEYQESTYTQDVVQYIEDNLIQETILPTTDRDLCLVSLLNQQEWSCLTSSAESSFVHNLPSSNYLELN